MTSSGLFLLPGGGWSTIVIILLSGLIAVISFVKKCKGFGLLFTFIFVVLILAMIAFSFANNSGQPNAAVWTSLRQLGRLVRILPYFAFLWMIIKLKPASTELSG